MINESEMLWIESTTQDVMGWVLQIRKPGQRVMVTFYGRPDQAGLCDPTTWRKWHVKVVIFLRTSGANRLIFIPSRTAKRR